MHKSTQTKTGRQEKFGFFFSASEAIVSETAEHACCSVGVSEAVAGDSHRNGSSLILSSNVGAQIHI